MTTRLTKELLQATVGKIKGKRIASGWTTQMFECKDKNYLIGYTTDNYKIKWLVGNNIGDIKLLSEKSFNKITIYKYKIRKLQSLNKYQIKYIKCTFLDIMTMAYVVNEKVTVKDTIPHLLHFITDEHIRKILNDIYSIFKNDDIQLDLHSKQFMMDGDTIVCIDPVFECNSLS